MAIAKDLERGELTANRSESAVDGPAVLTLRGRAAARLIAFEDVWAELDGADRAYFASELEQLAREALTERMADRGRR